MSAVNPKGGAVPSPTPSTGPTGGSGQALAAPTGAELREHFCFETACMADGWHRHKDGGRYWTEPTDLHPEFIRGHIAGYEQCKQDHGIAACPLPTEGNDDD